MSLNEMSLFVINRYEGEKEVGSRGEKNHLSELLKRIEERKKERIVKKESLISEEDNVQNAKEDEHKRKKRKVEISKECPSEDAFVEKGAEVQFLHLHGSHKRTRKKEKSIHSIEHDVDYEGIEDEDNKLQEAITDDKKNTSSNKSLDLNNVEEQNDFTVLGVKSNRKKCEVRRVLPEWLANPNIISNDLNDGPSLDSLDLNSVLDVKLIQALKANGIDKLFPVQASMITWLLKCNKDKEEGWWLRDTCVSAPTGSGKTLAYVLPIVHILQSRLATKIRCIIVVPVQELAAQVYKVLVTYTSHTTLTVGLLSGACSFEQEQNNIVKMDARGKYVSAVDIVVATPGRLIDHILKTAEFSLNDLRFLVIDEADRVADWIEYLPEPHHRAARLTLFDIRCSKAPVQKLLFSATLSQDPKKLNNLRLFQPVLFTSVLVSGKDNDINLDAEVGNYIGRYTSPEGLTEYAVECRAEYKPVALYKLLKGNNVIGKSLIFTNSGESAHRLRILLGSLLAEENVRIEKLSAQLKPKEREQVLGKFITGEVKILVSSDALARGVDIPDVETVVSYDPPKHIKGYIHRAGRTGRAGKSGKVISILTSKQVGRFRDTLSNAHKAIPHIEQLELNSIADSINYSSHVKKLKEALEEEKQERNLLRTKAVKRRRSNTTVKELRKEGRRK